MDFTSHCVYNVTRNALLSERVVSVSEPQTPSQLLALVMNGPGRDPHFCIRLTRVSLAADIPRLFAFDVAYLDDEQRILELADVGPGTPFPALNDRVATVLFLSDQLLVKSGTETGDFIRICTEAELAALLRVAAQFQAVESPGWPIESSGPASTVASDPFGGSLIYLPSSGTPQNTEIFLSSRATHSETPVEESSVEPLVQALREPLIETSADLFVEEYAEPLVEASSEPLLQVSPDQLVDASSEPFVDLAVSEPQVLDQSPQLAAHEVPPELGQDLLQSGQLEPTIDDVENLPFTLLSEAANHQTTPPESLPNEAQPPRRSRLSQFPFSFKAVIHFVDDQLRREKQQQEKPLSEEAPLEAGSEPANVSLEESLVPPEIEEPQAVPEQLVSSPLQEENAEMSSDVAAKDVPDLTEINAATTDEPESSLIEILPTEALQIPQISAEEFQPLPPPLQPQPYFSFYEVSQPPELVARAAPQPPPPSVAEPPHVAAQEFLPASAQTETQAPLTRITEPAPASRFSGREKLPFTARVQRWLAGESVSLSGNRRRGERIELPGLVAFYFTGGAPKAHEIVNISSTGLYLRSKELWSPNTLVRMTLERQDAEFGERKSISVLARVVRIDDGGIGHEFVTTEVLANLRTREFLPQQGTNRKELAKFLAIPK